MLLPSEPPPQAVKLNATKKAQDAFSKKIITYTIHNNSLYIIFRLKKIPTEAGIFLMGNYIFQLTPNEYSRPDQS